MSSESSHPLSANRSVSMPIHPFANTYKLVTHSFVPVKIPSILYVISSSLKKNSWILFCTSSRVRPILLLCDVLHASVAPLRTTYSPPSMISETCSKKALSSNIASKISAGIYFASPCCAVQSANRSCTSTEAIIISSSALKGASTISILSNVL